MLSSLPKEIYIHTPYTYVMTKLEKQAGAKASCPSCHKPMVCNEIRYKDEVKLQWQDEDTGKAHYSFDFKTKTTSCAQNSAATAKRVEGVKSRGEIHLKDLKLSLEQLQAISAETHEILDRQLARIYYIEEGLKAKGIDCTGPFVGMLYIQQMEALRAA